MMMAGKKNLRSSTLPVAMRSVRNFAVKPVREVQKVDKSINAVARWSVFIKLLTPKPDEFKSSIGLKELENN